MMNLFVGFKDLKGISDFCIQDIINSLSLKMDFQNFLSVALAITMMTWNPDVVHEAHWDFQLPSPLQTSHCPLFPLNEKCSLPNFLAFASLVRENTSRIRSNTPE